MYLRLDLVYQVVRDEFMNDEDAASQALAVQCLQVLLPACWIYSMPHMHQQTRCIVARCPDPSDCSCKDA